MKVLGQLESATLEVLSSDPSSNVAGRFWFNSADGHAKIDSGSQKRSILLNDDKLIIGTSGTATANVRAHRGGASLLQFVLGDDTTSEGTLSTSLAQLSSRVENYTDAGKPAFGNAGRLVYLTDLQEVKADTGSGYVYPIKLNSIAPSTTKGDLIVHDGATNVRQAVGADGLFLKADSTSATGVAYATVGNITVSSKTANYTLTSTDDAIDADGSSGAFTLTLPAAASVPGKKFILKRVDDTLANPITISGTIDGDSNWFLHTKGECYEIFSDGTEYKILNHRASTSFSTPTTVTIRSSVFSWTWATVSDVAGSLQNKYATFETVSSAGAFTKRYIWFNVGGLGTDPALAGRTAHVVAFAANATANTIATAIAAVLNPLTDLVSTAATNVVTNTQAFSGVTEDPTSGNSGFTTTITNSAVKGTTAIDKIYWRREGDSARVRLDYRQTVAGTLGNGDYLFALPTGLIANTTLIVPNPTAQGVGFGPIENSVIGFIHGSDSTAVDMSGAGFLWDSKNIIFWVTRNAAGSNGGAIVGSGGSGLNDSAQQYHADLLIPIQDWKA